jgi:N-acetylglucosamine malate deacetylase 1
MDKYDKYDVLAFAAHPDDVELFAGGTVCRLVDQGYRVGIVDLTLGELGSRGTPEIRADEARKAASILGVSSRRNLELPDGDILNNADNRLLVIREIRRCRPDIMLINAPECRHPDHGAAARLVGDAVFYSGLSRIECSDEQDVALPPWRPHHVLHYMQNLPFEPTLVVDVSSVWERRMKAVRAFGSQFYDPSRPSQEGEPETFISNPEFLEWIDARARTYGYRAGATFGEPFLYRHGPIGTDDLVTMLSRPN